MELNQIAATTTDTVLRIPPLPAMCEAEPTYNIGALLDGLSEMMEHVRGGPEAYVRVRVVRGNIEFSHGARVVNKSGSLLPPQEPDKD